MRHIQILEVQHENYKNETEESFTIYCVYSGHDVWVFQGKEKRITCGNV